MLRNYGYDATAYQNDQAAMVDVALRLRQAQEMQERLRPHMSEFETYLAQKQQAAQPKQEPWFKAPEYDPKWKDAIGTDAAGNPYLKSGYPADTIQKIQAWNAHQQDLFQRFSQDPIGTIKPGLEQVVQEIAGRLVQQHLSQYQERIQAQQILAQNAQWMVDPSTQQMTEWGQRYRQYVGEAARLGIAGSAEQDYYAANRVKGDMAMAQLQSRNAPAAAQAAGEAQKQAFLNGGRHQPSPAGATPQNGGTQPKRGIRNAMLGAAAAAGLNLSERG